MWRKQYLRYRDTAINQFDRRLPIAIPAVYELLKTPCRKIFSECELTFTFVRYMLSPICLSTVCRLSVTLVRPTRQYFYGIWYLSHPLTSTENFTEIVPGEPLRRGS